MQQPGATVALLTPPGRGALAVVGLRGSAATALLIQHFLPRGAPPGEWPCGRLGLGSWRGVEPTHDGGIAAEDVVAVRTGDGWEIHCHGGVAAPAAILEDLVRAGAALVPAREWAGGGDAAADALELLHDARGPRAAAILSRQYAGALDGALARLASCAAADPAAAAVLAARLVAAARVGLRLATPWRVVLAGEVNAGKSSLANALAGHSRSIVSPHPGTTRDVVETSIVLGGWEVVLVDTAGMSGGEDRRVDAIERAGQERARAAIGSADLVVRVVEAGGAVPDAGPGGIVALSKADRMPAGWRADGALATSAVTGAGIDDLAAAIIDRLVPEERLDPESLTGPVPFLERHLARIRGIVGVRGTAQ